jgi:Tfp pilus assembly protein PilV
MRNFLKEQSGFSIMEISVVVLIVAIGLIGILSLVNQSIKAQQINRNQLIASQLAQEGIELVRNRRDKNWLTAGYDWKNGEGAGTNSDIVQDSTYTIDYLGNINPSVDAITDSAAKLKIDASGFYNHSSGNDSIFSRLISINEFSNYLKVESWVQWRDGQGTHNYKVSTFLYDWR